MPVDKEKLRPRLNPSKACISVNESRLLPRPLLQFARGCLRMSRYFNYHVRETETAASMSRLGLPSDDINHTEKTKMRDKERKTQPSSTGANYIFDTEFQRDCRPPGTHTTHPPTLRPSQIHPHQHPHPHTNKHIRKYQSNHAPSARTYICGRPSLLFLPLPRPAISAHGRECGDKTTQEGERRPSPTRVPSPATHSSPLITLHQRDKERVAYA